MILLTWEHKKKKKQIERHPMYVHKSKDNHISLRKGSESKQNTGYPWEGDFNFLLYILLHCLIFIYNDNILRCNLYKLISKEFQ